MEPPPTLNVEILIVTHRKDGEFLSYLMRSIEKNVRGFGGVTIVIPKADSVYFRNHHKLARVLAFDEPAEKGFLAHMIRICRADELCPQADIIVHVDADCLFWREVTPSEYVIGGKCRKLVEPFAEIENPNRHIWKKCIERAAGFTPEFETMVAHPQVYHRGLYPHVRALVEKHTGKSFDEYVYSCENGFPQGFAEHPLLGSVALRDFPEKYLRIDYEHNKDAKLTGRKAGTFQYAYQPSRDALVEGWTHSGLARYHNDWDRFLSGNLPEWHIK